MYFYGVSTREIRRPKVPLWSGFCESQSLIHQVGANPALSVDTHNEAALFDWEGVNFDISDRLEKSGPC